MHFEGLTLTVIAERRAGHAVQQLSVYTHTVYMLQHTGNIGSSLPVPRPHVDNPSPTCPGAAHWEVLLRARAIECQSYVIAAAQAGKHSEKRESYGHALIIDPWGR